MLDIPEEGQAALYGGGIIGTTWLLAENAWFSQSNSILSRLYESATMVIAPTQIQMAVLGVWIGLVSVWALDTYKKRLVFAPILFGVTILYTVDAKELATGLSLESSLVFVVAAGLVAQRSGLPLYRFFRGEIPSLIPSGSPVELPAAPRGFFWLLVSFVGIGLVDMHVNLDATPVFTWESRTSLGTILAGVILVVLFGIITRYEAEQRIIQLGPTRAGKTTMMAGLLIDAPESNTEDTRLKELRRQLIRGGELPTDRTSDAELVTFSYLSTNRIFTEKRTITTLDHGGELLTGESDSQTLAKKIKNLETDTSSPRALHLKILQGLRGLTPNSVWEQGIEKLEAANKRDKRTQRDALAHLVKGADLVLLTVPLGDFLDPVIEREKEPGYLPVYHDTETYEDAHVRENSLTNQDTEGHSESNIPAYAHRQGPGAYGTEYHELIDVFEDNPSTSFAWVVTKFDLAFEDYKKIYNGVARAVDDCNEDEEHTSVIEEVKNLDKAFQTNFPAVVRNENRDQEERTFEYKLLSEWVIQEYIKDEWNGFDDNDGMLPTSNQEFVYPVWFDIDDDDSTPGSLVLNNESRSEQILIGSHWLRERFEGSQLHNRELDIETCCDALIAWKNRSLGDDSP